MLYKGPNSALQTKGLTTIKGVINAEPRIIPLNLYQLSDSDDLEDEFFSHMHHLSSSEHGVHVKPLSASLTLRHIVELDVFWIFRKKPTLVVASARERNTNVIGSNSRINTQTH